MFLCVFYIEFYILPKDDGYQTSNYHNILEADVGRNNRKKQNWKNSKSSKKVVENCSFTSNISAIWFVVLRKQSPSRKTGEVFNFYEA